METDTCRFRFDPEKWERKHGRPAALDSTWSCTRKSESNAKFCLFHLPEEQRDVFGIDDKQLNSSLKDELTGDRDTSLRFIGAKFDDVDISHEVINRRTNNPIDFRHVTIQGDFIADQAAIRQPLLMDEAVIEGQVDFSDAQLAEDISLKRTDFFGETVFKKTEFEDDCDFTGSVFHMRADFTGAQFARTAEFYATHFKSEGNFEDLDWMGNCRFQQSRFDAGSNFHSSRFRSKADFRTVKFARTSRFSRCSFQDDALFIDCEFGAEALFKNVEFSAPAYYQNVEFRSEASFTEATFSDKAKFSFARFEGEGVFSYIDFNNAAYFTSADFISYASFYETEFHRLVDFRETSYTDTVRFMKATFDGEVFFDYATFSEEGDFREASFSDRSLFVETEFRGGAIMQDCLFDHCVFRDLRSAHNSLTLDLERARIDTGEIVQQKEAKVYYNVRDGRIGDIEIDMPKSERMFERFFIYRTDFSGFDFSRYRYILAPDWELHSFAGTTDHDYNLESTRFSLGNPNDVGNVTDSEEETGTSDDRINSLSKFANFIVDPAAPDLEVTYLKAKNGADAVGDSQSASRFFIKEMQYRRRAHLHRIFNHSEPLSIQLKLFFLTLMNLSLSLTCGYGEKPRRTLGFSVFTIGVYTLLFPAFVPNPPFGFHFGYLLLSIQSFVSLVFGQSASVPGFAGSLLAATEGFIGAFTIGLFIFALTRSVHR